MYGDSLDELFAKKSFSLYLAHMVIKKPWNQWFASYMYTIVML